MDFIYHCEFVLLCHLKFCKKRSLFSLKCFGLLINCLFWFINICNSWVVVLLCSFVIPIHFVNHIISSINPFSFTELVWILVLLQLLISVFHNKSVMKFLLILSNVAFIEIVIENIVSILLNTIRHSNLLLTEYNSITIFYVFLFCSKVCKSLSSVIFLIMHICHQFLLFAHVIDMFSCSFLFRLQL